MKKFLSLLMVCFVLVACSKDDGDDDQELMAQYLGPWQGTYAGDDSGTWMITIFEDGTVTGSAFSSTSLTNLDITGQVNPDGNINLTAGTVSNNATFTGSLNATNGTASGTWQNATSTPPSQGTWVGTKQ